MEFWRNRHGILGDWTWNFGEIDMEFWRNRHGISILLHERSGRSSTRPNSTNFGAKSQYMYVLQVVDCLASTASSALSTPASLPSLRQ